MKIGIVGPADRSVAWENHLQSHTSVSEVIITGSLKDLGDVDACFLLDDTDQRLSLLLDSIKHGYHTFFISALPTEQAIAEKLHRTAQEADVRLQFSHWPTLAPASQWMAKILQKPTFIQTSRELTYASFTESNASFDNLWIDELAYCLKYISGAVHKTEVNTVRLESGRAYATHIYLRFDSGATVGISLSIHATANRHHRLISDHTTIFNCDVDQQIVRVGREDKGGHLFFEKQQFDASRAAEESAMQFLKAIQLKKETLYDGYDLVKLSKTLARIQKQM